MTAKTPRANSPAKGYSRSKLANAIFVIELDRRFRAAGSPILSLLAHPGYSATNLQPTGPTGMGARVMKIGNAPIAQNADCEALPQLFAATAPTFHGGQFFGASGFGELHGAPTITHQLWSVSEELTGVTFPAAYSK
jgi:hypothetical protein